MIPETSAAVPLMIWAGLGSSVVFGLALVALTWGASRWGCSIRPDELGIVRGRFGDARRLRCRPGGFELAIPWFREVVVFSRAPVIVDVSERCEGNATRLHATAMARLAGHVDPPLAVRLLEHPEEYTREALAERVEQELLERLVVARRRAPEGPGAIAEARDELVRSLETSLRQSAIELLYADVHLAHDPETRK